MILHNIINDSLLALLLMDLNAFSVKYSKQQYVKKISHSKRQLNVGVIERIKHCVSSNLGVSFLPYFIVEQELRSGELKALIFAETPLTITGLCSYHAGKVVSPVIKVFIECVREYLPVNQEKNDVLMAY